MKTDRRRKRLLYHQIAPGAGAIAYSVVAARASCTPAPDVTATAAPFRA